MYYLNLLNNGRISSGQLQHELARLDCQGELHARRMSHLADIERIEARGIQYSNQDFDVLSSALNFLDAVNPGHELRTN